MKAIIILATILGFSTLSVAQTEIFFSESGLFPGENDNPVDPNSTVSLNNLKHLLNAPHTAPRHAPQDASQPKPQNPITSDYELSTFTRNFSGMEANGTSHTLRAAWSQNTPDGSTVYGARGNYQMLQLQAMKKSELFHNGSLGGNYEKIWKRLMDRDAFYGVSGDLLLYGNAQASANMLDSRIGAMLTGYGRGSFHNGIHHLQGATGLQYAYLGRFQQINALIGGAWRGAIHQNMDIKINAQMRTLLFQYDSHEFDQEPLNRAELHLGLGGAWWLSPSISIDAGYSTVLLISDLRVHTFNLGSRFAF